MADEKKTPQGNERAAALQGLTLATGEEVTAETLDELSNGKGEGEDE
ncbi:MAG: hypothetical protein LBQ15_07295 [Clostridium sp.]|jgi:hypothetical protein|nr:hypothetical protein [Clostridium sp.]